MHTSTIHHTEHASLCATCKCPAIQSAFYCSPTKIWLFACLQLRAFNGEQQLGNNSPVLRSILPLSLLDFRHAFFLLNSVQELGLSVPSGTTGVKHRPTAGVKIVIKKDVPGLPGTLQPCSLCAGSSSIPPGPTPRTNAYHEYSLHPFTLRTFPVNVQKLP